MVVLHLAHQGQVHVLIMMKTLMMTPHMLLQRNGEGGDYHLLRCQLVKMMIKTYCHQCMVSVYNCVNAVFVETGAALFEWDLIVDENRTDIIHHTNILCQNNVKHVQYIF